MAGPEYKRDPELSAWINERDTELTAKREPLIQELRGMARDTLIDDKFFRAILAPYSHEQREAIFDVVAHLGGIRTYGMTSSEELPLEDEAENIPEILLDEETELEVQLIRRLAGVDVTDLTIGQMKNAADLLLAARKYYKPIPKEETL